MAGPPLPFGGGGEPAGPLRQMGDAARSGMQPLIEAALVGGVSGAVLAGAALLAARLFRRRLHVDADPPPG